MISKAARERTLLFSPLTPWRPMARTVPSAVMTSATSMMWRMSTLRPCSERVLKASWMIMLRAASMPSSRAMAWMSLVVVR